MENVRNIEDQTFNNRKKKKLFRAKIKLPERKVLHRKLIGNRNEKNSL